MNNINYKEELEELGYKVTEYSYKGYYSIVSSDFKKRLRYSTLRRAYNELVKPYIK